MIILQKQKIVLPLQHKIGEQKFIQRLILCSVRLGVRTCPFHGQNTGSIPVPSTKILVNLY
jgi:hypothetical protein